MNTTVGFPNVGASVPIPTATGEAPDVDTLRLQHLPWQSSVLPSSLHPCEAVDWEKSGLINNHVYDLSFLLGEVIQGP